MADGLTSAKVDISSALAGLAKLAGENRTHLARSMAVAGGQVMRDEAKARAPVGGDLSVQGHQHGESNRPGLLKASIYLAFKDGMSNADHVTYGVTWNHKIAPHGHLVEFGHWQTHKAYIGSDGYWYSSPIALAQPRWIPAHPFLRPAYESAKTRATEAMMERGRERLQELLTEHA